MAAYFNPRKALIQTKNWESFCCHNCSRLVKDGRLQCSCGENFDAYSWHWEKQIENNVILSLDDREVLFHPVYSTGTAAVKGVEPLKLNCHHYWEIKVLTNLYGTDIMIGVGTSKVSFSERQYKFCSLLGYDNQSWGFSYHGIIQHNKLIRKYGALFGLGSIIGVHLDMCTGTLEYYLNRKPLGIAFTGLKRGELFPMVSSTAAQSGVRMICSLTLPPTLQLKCLMVIQKHPHLIKGYHNVPGLSRLMRKEYFWLIPPPITVPEQTEQKNRFCLEDEVVLPLQTILNSAKRRKCARLPLPSRWRPHSSIEHVSMQNILRIVNENRRESESGNSSHDENRNPARTRINQNRKALIKALPINDKEDVVNLNIDECYHLPNCDKADVIINCDNYLNSASCQDVNVNVNVNVNEASSSSSIVYENMEVDYNDGDGASENDLSSLEGRYCEMCSVSFESDSELSQNRLCSVCDVII